MVSNWPRTRGTGTLAGCPRVGLGRERSQIACEALKLRRWQVVLFYKGEPTGTAASDNARVILEQAERVDAAVVSQIVWSCRRLV